MGRYGQNGQGEGKEGVGKQTTGFQKRGKVRSNGLSYLVLCRGQSGPPCPLWAENDASRVLSTVYVDGRIRVDT